ncbi:Uma2 family endonuclease [Cyanobacteria bacterium FACHB-63]|nr:Uma2 family endonuclease [Cyanobacteria bacterium FACHB-63]
MSQDLLNDEDIITELDISHLAIEDDTPVDNFQSEEQQRLLVEPLYSSKALPAPFLAAANVGLFYKLKGDPIVPDAMLSLGVQRAEDLSQRRNRSYFVWEFGKVPEVCIEIVSNQEGDKVTLSQKSRQKGKTTAKKDIYAQIGARCYVVFDPLQQIQADMNGALLRVWEIAQSGYVELTPLEGLSQPGQFVWLEAVGLGLSLWEGQFEDEITRLWLRWCDRSGQVIPTGAEGLEMERQRAEIERRQAEAERQRAETERQRAERLAERLRALGIDPDEA